MNLGGLKIEIPKHYTPDTALYRVLQKDLYDNIQNVDV
jgi:hypothetical protein